MGLSLASGVKESERKRERKRGREEGGQDRERERAQNHIKDSHLSIPEPRNLGF